MQEIRDALFYGAHFEAATAITRYNADINAFDDIWGGILLYAVVRDSIPAIEALAARGDYDLQRRIHGDPVLMAVTRPVILQALLRCFPDIDVNVCMTGYRSESALAHAAFHGCMESVQLLLDAGANPVLGAPQIDARLGGYETIATLIEQHAAWANGLRRAWTRAIVDASVL